jgi:hypothetical protein
MGGRGQGFPVPVRPFLGWETPVPTGSFLSLPRQCIRKCLRFPRERIFCRGERRMGGSHGQGFLVFLASCDWRGKPLSLRETYP